MKTILYNPIFINPQAYYVFPRLTRWLQPDEESVLEPANYIGSIEVKIIAYGDFEIGYTRNFMNTSEIDFSDFRNSYVRISLFTPLGSVVLGEWKIGDLESTIIDPAVLESLKAVVICDGKTNEDSDRATIRNLVDPDNPFVASNFAWTEDSGYNKSTYDGALVFDGVNDRVISTKTMQEMVGDTNAVTVVSMIHQISLHSTNTRNNYVRPATGSGYMFNNVETTGVGKTGIYGYSGSFPSIKQLSPLLGDKADYSVAVAAFNGDMPVFSVNGFIQGSEYAQMSQNAWYWTIIANKVLTTDEIHQIIAYYNLDKHVKPDIYYDVKKQGLTNENHAQFGDKLIDYSGNGHDMPMYNIGWDETSGVNADGSLVLDGVNDYGKVTGVPVYKDYTVVGEYIKDYSTVNAPFVSKSQPSSNGAFIMDIGAETYSFMARTGSLTNPSINTRYQSKYSYNGKAITAGTIEDSDILLLGTVRNNDNRFARLTFNYLMTFPYSLDEFLIERQLKKHKLGTLHEDMIEFRPIVKIDGVLNKIMYYVGTTVLNPGDYIAKNTVIKMVVYSNGQEDEFNKIKVSGKDVTYTLGTASDGLITATVDNIIYTKSPLKIEVSLDNYIRFEDIQQPYPIVFYFTDKDGKEYTFGDKIKYGAVLNISASDNLLNDLYDISAYTYNNTVYGYIQLEAKDYVVGKDSLKFSSTTDYKLTNEPNVIASPQKLRLPNISYKRLGYIPDISGHGNNIKLYNSGYSGMSGANGYGTDFTKWSLNSATAGTFLVKEESYIEYQAITNLQNLLSRRYSDSETFALYADVDIELRYSDEESFAFIKAGKATKVTIPKTGTVLVRSTNAVTAGDIITIQQVGLYDGAFCFDGVNDYGNINKSIISKQQFIKLNRLTDKNASIIDNRLADIKNSYIISSQSSTAYVNYDTYIDGILNKNILTEELNGITHNAMIQNETNVASPVTIMASYDRYNYLNAAMYAYASFPEISDESEIIRFNEIMGIEGKYVERPMRYFDAYGKTNQDTDKDTITDQVTKLPANALSLKNIAYEGMSGYNGYPVVFGANKTWDYVTPSSDDGYKVSLDTKTITITQISIGNILISKMIKINGELTNENKEISSFRLRVTGIDSSKFVLRYYYVASANDVALANYAIISDGVHKLPKSFASDGSLTAQSAWIGFNIFGVSGVTGIVSDVNVTLEVLPDYENGLALDGVNDYLENTTLPALTDFTFITKRKNLLSTYEDGTMYIMKGLENNKWALLGDYWSGGKNTQYSFGQTNIATPFDLIGFITPTSYNGTAMTKGTTEDSTGMHIGGWSKYWKGVFYNLMLFDRTINMLSINMIKNLMNKDGIVDLSNPVFKNN